MHEASLMYDILRTLEASAEDNGIGEITELKLVIGNIATIFPDALQFAFDSYKGSPPLAADAVLELEERWPEGICRDCGKKFTLKSAADFTCPACGGHDIKIEIGEEVYIDYYKGRERSDVECETD